MKKQIRMIEENNTTFKPFTVNGQLIHATNPIGSIDLKLSMFEAKVYLLH